MWCTEDATTNIKKLWNAFNTDIVTCNENALIIFVKTIYFFLQSFASVIKVFYILTYRRYIPKLKDYPNRYIYEPWNAPESVQKAANCIVGVDYPKPMINHAESSRLNIERMKQVYQQLSHYRGLSE